MLLTVDGVAVANAISRLNGYVFGNGPVSCQCVVESAKADAWIIVEHFMVLRQWQQYSGSSYSPKEYNYGLHS